MKNMLIFVVCVFLTLAVTTQGCTRCGTSGACCAADETCEATVDDGKCYKTKDKYTCNSRFYCYKPRICCGDSFFKTVCCPENTQCCGGMPPICCPLNSQCGPLVCIANSGSSGSSSRSSKSSGTTFGGWYYILIAVPVLGACITVGVCLWLRNKRSARAHKAMNQGVVYSRRTTSSPNTIATIGNVKYGVASNPPVYSISTQNAKVPVSGIASYGCVKTQSGQTISHPPAYSKTIRQSGSAQGIHTAASLPQGTINVDGVPNGSKRKLEVNLPYL